MMNVERVADLGEAVLSVIEQPRNKLYRIASFLDVPFRILDAYVAANERRLMSLLRVLDFFTELLAIPPEERVDVDILHNFLSVIFHCEPSILLDYLIADKRKRFGEFARLLREGGLYTQLKLFCYWNPEFKSAAYLTLVRHTDNFWDRAYSLYYRGTELLYFFVMDRAPRMRGAFPVLAM